MRMMMKKGWKWEERSARVKNCIWSVVSEQLYELKLIRIMKYFEIRILKCIQDS